MRRPRRWPQLHGVSLQVIEALLFKLGRHEEALVQLQRAHQRLNDQEVAAHVVEVMAVLERRDEALELLLVAEQKDPDSELLKDVRKRYFSEAP